MESPWHSGIIIFRMEIGHSKLLFSVILKALHPALPGLTAGWLAVCPADELTVSMWIFKNRCSFKC